MFKGEFFFLILDHLVLILHFAARLVEHQFHRKHKYKSRLRPGGMMLLFLLFLCLFLLLIIFLFCLPLFLLLLPKMHKL